MENENFDELEDDIYLKENPDLNIEEIEHFLASIYNHYKKFRCASFENKTICSKAHPLVYYVDEKDSKKSPIAILSAEWGTGKTHFIGELAQYIKTENFRDTIEVTDKSETFFKYSKLIVINMLNYSSVEDFEEQLLYDFNCIMKNSIKDPLSYKKSLIIKKNTEGFFSSITVGCQYVNFDFSPISKFVKKEFKSLSILWEYHEIFSPVLIFLDNMERLSTDGARLLRIVNKFCQLPGLIVCISTNIKKLDAVSDNDFFTSDAENWLSKFIDLPVYNILSGKNAIIESNIKDNDLKQIFKLLTESISKKISNRQFEATIRANDYNRTDAKLLICVKKFLRDFNININDEAINKINSILKQEFDKLLTTCVSLFEKFHDIINIGLAMNERSLHEPHNQTYLQNELRYLKEFSYIESSANKFSNIAKKYENLQEMKNDMDFRQLSDDYIAKILEFSNNKNEKLQRIVSQIKDAFNTFQRQLGISEETLIPPSVLDVSNTKDLAKSLSNFLTNPNYTWKK